MLTISQNFKDVNIMVRNLFKSILFVLGLSFCLAMIQPLCVSASALSNNSSEITPLKVAVMPTISRVRGNRDILTLLDKDIDKQMHLSLNDTLQLVDYLDQNKVSYAMEESGFMVKPNMDTLKHTADLLDADIIVGYTVPIMYEQYFHSYARRGEGPLMRSYIILKLWAYYKPLNNTFVLSDKRHYFDEISTSGSLNALADNASYYLGQKADLKNLLKDAIKVNQQASTEQLSQ